MNFSDVAENWDTEYRVKRAKIIADEVNKFIIPKEEQCALEFGCGTGLVSFNLQDKFKHITLIDSSKGMIEKLNSKIQHLNIHNMKAYHMDINDMRWVSEKYDFIYVSMALHHIKDIKQCLEILYKLLKSDGCLCIVDLVEDDGSFHKLELDFDGHNGFNTVELIKTLDIVGFKNIDTYVFYQDTKNIEDLIVDYSLFLMAGYRA